MAVEADMSLHPSFQSRNRATSRLSATRVAKIKEPGLYEDGAGLRLVVTPSGVKRWVLRFTLNGRRVERGLGVWPGDSLESARRRSETIRAAAKEGRDAIAELRQPRAAKNVTFRNAFDQFFEVRRQRLRNAKHSQQWRNTMRDYVFPFIGNRPVAEVSAAEVISLLQPIWFSKPETALRVFQRVKATFDGAILRGTREKANPCVGIVQELGTGHRKTEHHRALPWQQGPSFVHALRESTAAPVSKLLFEFLILTASRSGEARGALWDEIDYENGLWTIAGFDAATGRRMKQGEQHVVPLSRQAVCLLNEARRLHDGVLVFPNAHGKPISDNTLSKYMRDNDLPGTPHGFRSAFKDWAAENGVRDEVSEAALAHADRDKVRAAYRRTRFLDERRIVMQQWADFVADRVC